MNKFLHVSILTHEAPSANYRGESTDNRVGLQVLTVGGESRAVISSEAIKNAIRERMEAVELPCNRKREHGEDQLAVSFAALPDPDTYIDDFMMGFMVADPKAAKALSDLNRPAKRDAVLQMNMAVSTAPFRHEALLHQSPLAVARAGEKAPPYKNSTTSALINAETLVTAFQYTFSIDLGRCSEGAAPKWTRALLKIIGELSGVAGNHARTLFPFSPRSIVARLTERPVSGFNVYGFDAKGEFADLPRIGHPEDSLPADEFYLGGELVRNMSDSETTRLKAAGVRMQRSAELTLAEIAKSLP